MPVAVSTSPNQAFFCLFFVVVILILMYAFIVLVLFSHCQVDFDVNNIQGLELVNLSGV